MPRPLPSAPHVTRTTYPATSNMFMKFIVAQSPVEALEMEAVGLAPVSVAEDKRSHSRTGTITGHSSTAANRAWQAREPVQPIGLADEKNFAGPTTTHHGSNHACMELDRATGPRAFACTRDARLPRTCRAACGCTRSSCAATQTDRPGTRPVPPRTTRSPMHRPRPRSAASRGSPGLFPCQRSANFPHCGHSDFPTRLGVVVV